MYRFYLISWSGTEVLSLIDDQANYDVLYLSSSIISLGSSPVDAHPVETSLGAEPHVSYTGNFIELGTSSVNLITVPAGQDLIINAATCNGNCLLSIDGSPVVSESMHATDHNYSGGVFVAGNANLVVPSGSTLSISMSSTDNYTYFVNGRLVHQNHPRRSFFGQLVLRTQNLQQ